MVFRLTPRSDSFFAELFVTSAGLLNDGARLLSELLAATPEDRPALAARMRELEHRADEATHAIVAQVDAAFITPYDRDDIHELAARLDDCMDHMDRAGDYLDAYALDRLPERTQAQVSAIARMAQLTLAVLPALRDRARVREYVVEINRLENVAESEHRRLRAQLLSGDPEQILVILKILDVADELDSVCDCFERLAHAVEVISLKAT